MSSLYSPVNQSGTQQIFVEMISLLALWLVFHSQMPTFKNTHKSEQYLPIDCSGYFCHGFRSQVAAGWSAMGKARRAKECLGIVRPITRLNKPFPEAFPGLEKSTSSVIPSPSVVRFLSLLCDGRGGGREKQGNPEEDDYHRQPITDHIKSVKLSKQATMPAEISCTKWTSCDGQRAWWTWCWWGRRAGWRSPRTSSSSQPAHPTSTPGACSQVSKVSEVSKNTAVIYHKKSRECSCQIAANLFIKTIWAIYPFHSPTLAA